MQTWITRKKQTVLEPDHGRFLKVEQHEVSLPDARGIPDWLWIVTPDFISVVLVTENNDYVCFRQTKYAMGGTSLGIVGCFIETGEDSLVDAKRAVLEETGDASPDWTFLGRFPVDANRGAGHAHFYLACDARWK